MNRKRTIGVVYDVGEEGVCWYDKEGIYKEQLQIHKEEAEFFSYKSIHCGTSS